MNTPGFRRTLSVIEANLRRAARSQAKLPPARFARELPHRQEHWTDASTNGRRTGGKPRQPVLATYRAVRPPAFALPTTARLAPETVWARGTAAALRPHPAQRVGCAPETVGAVRPALTASGPPPGAPAASAADADAQLAEILAPLSKAERYSAAMLALKRVRRTAGAPPSPHLAPHPAPPPPAPPTLTPSSPRSPHP